MYGLASDSLPQLHPGCGNDEAYDIQICFNIPKSTLFQFVLLGIVPSIPIRLYDCRVMTSYDVWLLESLVTMPRILYGISTAPMFFFHSGRRLWIRPDVSRSASHCEH